MVTQKQKRKIKREITRSFSSAREALSRQEKEIKGRIGAEQQKILSQRQSLQAQQASVSTAQAIRRLTKGSAAQRRQFIGKIGQAKETLRAGETRLVATSQEVSQQFSKARADLAQQEREATQEAIESTNLANIRVQEPTITVTRTGPQFLDPVRAIDFVDRPGIIIREGEPGFTTVNPREAVKEFELSKGITVPKVSPPKVDVPNIETPSLGRRIITSLRPGVSERSINRKRIAVGFGLGLASDVVSAASLRPASLFPQRKTTQTGVQLEEKSEKIRSEIGKVVLLPAQVEGFKQLREFRASEFEAKQVGEQQEKDVEVIKKTVKSLEGATKKQERLNEDISKGNLKGGFSAKEIKKFEERQASINKQKERALISSMKEGISTTTTIKDGVENISFSSKAIKTDIGSGASKQLAVTSSEFGRAARVGGALASEVGGGVLLGAATAGVGPGVGAIAEIPKAIRIGGTIVAGGLVAGSSVIGGIRGFQEGSPRGVGVSSAFLGAGKPIAQTAGFVGSSIAVSRSQAGVTLKKAERGGFTVEDSVKAGSKFRGQPGTSQVTVSKTKIPGTKITITQRANLGAKETREGARGIGLISTKVRGAKGIGATKVFIARQGSNTGVITVRGVKGGSAVDTFRIRTQTTSFDKVNTGFQGISKFKLNTISGIERLGPTEIVKGVKPSQIIPEFSKEVLTRFGTRIIPGDTFVGFSTTGQQGIQTANTFITAGRTTGVSAGTITEITEKAVSSGKIASLLAQKGGQLFPPTVAGTAPIITGFPTGTIIPTSQFSLGPAISSVSPQVTSTFTTGGLTLGSFGSSAFSQVPGEATLQVSGQDVRLSPAQKARLRVVQTPAPPTETVATGLGQFQITPPRLTTVQEPALTTTTIQTTSTIQLTPSRTRTPFGGGFGLPSGGSRFGKLSAKVQRAAYDVYVKGVKSKKYRKVGNDLPLGRALKKGATVTKQTIASRFKVLRDKKARTTKNDINFTPSAQNFRNFKIVKGRQVPLPRGPDKWEYIERRRRRLTTGAETGEIVSFQRPKGRRRRNVFGF